MDASGFFWHFAAFISAMIWCTAFVNWTGWVNLAGQAIYFPVERSVSEGATFSLGTKTFMEASTLPVTISGSVLGHQQEPNCPVGGYPSLLVFFVAVRKRFKIQVFGAQSKDWGRAAFAAKASAVVLLSAMLNIFIFLVVNPISKCQRMLEVRV